MRVGAVGMRPARPQPGDPLRSIHTHVPKRAFVNMEARHGMGGVEKFCLISISLSGYTLPL